MFIEDEYLEKDGEDGYIFESNNDIEVDNINTTFEQPEKQESVEISETQKTPSKGAVGVVTLLGIIVFIESIADKNGVDVVDWAKSKFSKKPQQNNYCPPDTPFW